MRSTTNRLIAALAAVVVVMGSGCDDAATTMETTQAPQASLNRNPLVLRAIPAAEETAVVVIDERGGEVKAGGHMLIVPRDAVEQPTQFTMRVVPGSFVQVDLTAVRVSNGMKVTAFPIDLRLKLNYRSAIVADEDRLEVAYLVDDSPFGNQEELNSEVDVYGKWVTARVRHFSQYAMVVD
jgi:hypothetical protein